MKLLQIYILAQIMTSLIGCSKPPCSEFEFPYKYTLVKDNKIIVKEHCLMKCPYGCGVGRCLENGQCECKNGAIHMRDYFTNMSSPYMCSYHCDTDMCNSHNAVCHMGVICRCNPGFYFEKEIDCCLTDTEDPCKGNCLFGECDIEGDCDCFYKRGFKMNEEDEEGKEVPAIDDFAEKPFDEVPQKCVPDCLAGCPPFAKCVLPRICECNDGYHADEEQSCVKIEIADRRYKKMKKSKTTQNYFKY